MWHEPISRSSSKTTDENVFKYVIKLEKEYRVGESLGEGAFGQIVKVRHKLDDNEYAIKIIKLDSEIDDLTEIEREVKNLSQLNHKNIVRYFNAWTEIARLPVHSKKLLNDEESLMTQINILLSNGYFKSETELKNEKDENFEEIRFLFIQMELCETRTLRTVINENLYLDEEKLTKYFTEICEGLSHVHQQNIVHRDIKPENIFLTSRDEIKIGDFGLSKKLTNNHSVFLQKNENSLPFGSLTDACGTPLYIAPELYKRNTFNIKVDIYSLGIMYFEMCSQPIKTQMEKCQTFPLTSQKLKTVRFTKNDTKKKFLLKKLVHLNDTERPTCEQILEILKPGKSAKEINEMIQQNKRISRQQLKIFQRGLKSDNCDLTTFVTSTAVKIFELHGAQNIQMPTFVPSFSSVSDNLITLLNRRGKSSSVSNTSRIAFSYYVTANNINNIRRYCIGKVFEEGFYSPNEYQECVFQAVSSEAEDTVNDAEILHIGQKLCESIFPGETNEM